MADLGKILQELREVKLGPKEILSVVADLLDSLEPGPLGSAFPALARHVGMIAYEGVSLREVGGFLEVLLRRREEDDPAYAGLWHCPGTIIRAKKGGGESENEALSRLLKREFGDNVHVIRDINCGVVYNSREERGPCASMVHLLMLSGVQETKILKWFSVSDLPATIVDFHRDAVIPIAMGYLRRFGW